MIFKHLEFNDIFFTLALDDGRKMSLPYSKIDMVTHHPSHGLMTVSTKGHGTFDKTYESIDHLEDDMFKLMSKGKAAC